MKKRLLIISALAICLSLFISGTLAYFTSGEIARNVITAGNIKIDLIETDGQGNPFEDVSDVMPGAEIAKVVTVKNTGDNSCWVRIGLEKAIILAEGMEGEIDLSLVLLDLNTTDWTEKDGFFYYNRPLEPKAVTEPLFTTVTFDPMMDNLYQGSTATVTVEAQAVQTANNGSTVFEANGWPAAN